MVAFVLGLTLSLNLPVPLAAVLCPVLALGTALLVAPARRWRVWGWLGLGVIWGAATAAFMHQARPPTELHGADVTVTGSIRGLVETDEGRARFRLRPERITPYPKGRPRPRTIQVSWYDPDQQPRAGERWHFSLRLKRPRGLLNPVRFDYERHLASQRVDARAYVREPGSAHRLTGGSWVGAARGAIAHRLTAHAPAGDGAAVLRALAVGDRRGFSEGLWRTLRVTGTAHLVALSGLHIGLAATLGWLLGGAFVRMLPALNRRVPARALAGWFAVALAGGYTLLAGGSLPTVRALLMLALVVACLVWRRRASAPRVVVIALVVMAALTPWSVLGAGFWLSFGAVALLIAAARTAPLGCGRVVLAVRCQFVLAFGMAALTLGLFGQGSWLALPVNLVAIPVFSLVLVPAALVSALLAAVLPETAATAFVIQTTAAALDAVIAALAAIAAPAAPLRAGGGMGAAVAAALVLAALALRGLVPRLLPLGVAAALLLPAPKGGEAIMRLTVLEVGQGTAAVLAGDGGALVYDTGPRWGDTAAARFSLLPFLRQHDHMPVERLVVSHGDDDHAGGLSLLRREDAYRRALGGERLPGVPRRCRSGQRWRQGPAMYRVLWPPAGHDLTGNPASCVLLIEVVGRRMLLTGDIGHRAEAAVAARLRGPVDVLLVPHHGSADASSPAFLAAARPAIAIISAGYDNAYGLPDPTVVRRYRRAGARVLNTARDGAVTVRLSRSGAMATTAERARRRYFNEGLRGVSFRASE